MRYSYSELYHHGVKGMKWGVRRYQNEDGSLTAAGKKRQAKQEAKAVKKYSKKLSKDWINIHNEAADVNDSKAKSLYNKYKGIDFKKNKKAYRSYVDEYVKQWNDDLVSTTIKRLGAKPDSITTDDILSMIPTSISSKGADSMYRSLYEDED